MAEDSGTTVGVWIPDDSDIVAEFDAVVCDGEARSKQLREAMRLLVLVEEIREEAGYAMDDRQRRAWVQSALRAQLRRERDE
jgi:hypothetical protein